jgi:hypothetical protein
MGGGDIFGFSAGQHNGGLFLAALADGSACKFEDETGHGFTIVNIACPVGVHKTVQHGPVRCAVLENKVMTGGGVDVPKHAIEGTLVVRARSGSMSPKGSHSVGEVRTASQHGIHQCIKGALICVCIDLSYGEFYQMFVWERRGAYGTGIRLSEMLEYLQGILLLGDGNPSCVPVVADVHAEYPREFPEVRHLVGAFQGLFVSIYGIQHAGHHGDVVDVQGNDGKGSSFPQVKTVWSVLVQMYPISTSISLISSYQTCPPCLVLYTAFMRRRTMPWGMLKPGGGSMKSSSVSSLLRYANFTSIWWSSRSCSAAIARITRRDASFAMGAKVLS